METCKLCNGAGCRECEASFQPGNVVRFQPWLSSGDETFVVALSDYERLHKSYRIVSMIPERGPNPHLWSRPMADETITPEALDRLEKVKHNLYIPIQVKVDVSALLAAYRAQESELRIAMRALEIGYEQERYTTWEKDEWLAEARAQEGKPDERH